MENHMTTSKFNAMHCYAVFCVVHKSTNENPHESVWKSVQTDFPRYIAHRLRHVMIKFSSCKCV